MTTGNFDWFLHSMLFYHTKHVLKKQEIKLQKAKNAEDDESSDDEDEDTDSNM
jgi:hypothetical protein